MKPIFVTGIGTDVGKTLVSAIVAEALGASYWKPVQAGFEQGTDAGTVASWLSHPGATIYPECYKLQMAASPHIAARQEGLRISRTALLSAYTELPERAGHLVVEGAGGLMVPLADDYFVADLIRDLQARVLIVSRNYLGSINHSLLTAQILKGMGADVIGWVFNDQYLHYEDEIAAWSGYPRIGSIPFIAKPNKAFVAAQAALIRPELLQRL